MKYVAWPWMLFTGKYRRDNDLTRTRRPLASLWMIKTIQSLDTCSCTNGYHGELTGQNYTYFLTDRGGGLVHNTIVDENSVTGLWRKKGICNFNQILIRVLHIKRRNNATLRLDGPLPSDMLYTGQLHWTEFAYAFKRLYIH